VQASLDETWQIAVGAMETQLRAAQEIRNQASHDLGMAKANLEAAEHRVDSIQQALATMRGLS
jgi:hypothetical protein